MDVVGFLVRVVVGLVDPVSILPAVAFAALATARAGRAAFWSVVVIGVATSVAILAALTFELGRLDGQLIRFHWGAAACTSFLQILLVSLLFDRIRRRRAARRSIEGAPLNG